MSESKFAGPIYPAKSARIELIDVLTEQIHASYQPIDRASITRPVLDRVVADLEHAVLLLDALQEARQKISDYEHRQKASELERPDMSGQKEAAEGEWHSMVSLICYFFGHRPSKGEPWWCRRCKRTFHYVPRRRR